MMNTPSTPKGSSMSSYYNNFNQKMNNSLGIKSPHEKKPSPHNPNEYHYEGIVITDVWRENLDEEMHKIMQIVETNPYVAMDTEFPGVVVRPVGNFRTSSEYHYQTLRCNVNLLKIIQLGLTFSDQTGTLPKYCTWQFHFKFNLKEDMYAQDSIELLTNSGIDFKKHEEHGIDVNDFGALLTVSGIVLNKDVRWISFHGAYDFGYLVKLLTNSQLPETEVDFFNLLRDYFPNVYDIKYLMRSVESLKGGLNQLAEDLKVSRIGPAHQAGSDSLLTLHTFFKMMQLYFENKFDDNKYLGILYGLGEGAVDDKLMMMQFAAAAAASGATIGNGNTTSGSGGAAGNALAMASGAVNFNVSGNGGPSAAAAYNVFAPQGNTVIVNDKDHSAAANNAYGAYYPSNGFYGGLTS